MYRSLGEDAPHAERAQAYDDVTKTYRAAEKAAESRSDVELPEISNEARARFLASDPRRPGAGE